MKENTKQKIKNIFIAIGFIITIELIGFISSLLSGNIKEVYNSLNKPPLSPPDFLFGIVWPIMFALIGLSIFFVWKNKPQNSKEIFSVFIIQIILNFLWTIFFFGLNLWWLALVDIILLVLIVAYLMFLTYKENKISFYLLIPYFLWLLFATYLNIGFIIVN